MNKWKALALLLLALLLVGGCLGQYLYITTLTEQLTGLTDRLTAAIRAQDLPAADTVLSEFRQKWEEHRRRLYSLANHSAVNGIETELAAFSEDLLCRNTPQLCSGAARLGQAVRALAQPEPLSLSNLL